MTLPLTIYRRPSMGCYAMSKTRFTCGIDLHAQELSAHIRDQDNKLVCRREIECRPDALLQLLKPFVPNVSVGVESTFNWYWVADVCREHKIPFYLGHALYMKHIHGAKGKNDR